MLGRAYMMDSENTQSVFQLGANYIKIWETQLQSLIASMNQEEKEKEIGNDSVGAVSDNSNQ